MAYHPLNDEFNIDPENLDDEFVNETEIPEEAQLNDIIKMSLGVYKDVMDNLQYIEVKHRPRHLDVAEKYLNQAKDAMYKKEQLLLNREKFEHSKKGKKDPEEGEDEPSGKVDRRQLLTEISNKRKASNEN